MATDRPNAKPVERSILRRLQELLGVGPILLVAGLLFEGLTIVAQQWISFPVPLAFEVQLVLTALCVGACLLGMIWFNRTLDLVRVHLRRGEHELVTWGPFAYVRHPLYAALMLTIPPLFVIWFSDLVFVAPWVLIVLFAHYVVSFEERKLVQEFGQAYESYRDYVPALLPYKGAGGRQYRRARSDPRLDPPHD
jgi:protein-S-isoprenylcysteine O-methyltransferase Ste14